MKEKLNDLENQISNLNDKVSMVDDYSKHFMNESMTIIGIVISIASVVLIGATYFMIKSMINEKMDREIEKKILRILGEQPPVYFAKGTSLPNEEGEIILSDDINGIEDLEPKTLLVLDAKVERTTLDQLANNLQYNLIINSKGHRAISFVNYSFSDEEGNGGNGQVTWALVWVRKYSK